MNGEPLRSRVKITNPQGFHIRPIAAFVRLASTFQSSVYVIKEDDIRIDGRSPISLMGLGAEEGTELILEVSGPDAQAALDALVQLMSTYTTEEEA